jgi:hypothetical protein
MTCVPSVLGVSKPKAANGASIEHGPKHERMKTMITTVGDQTSPEPKAPSMRGKGRPVRDGGKTGGLPALRNKLSGPTMAALRERRERLAREVGVWRQAVENDLGGQEALSAAQQTILDIAANKMAVARLLAEWIQARPTRIVDGRQGKARGIVTDYLRASESVEKSLVTLGLKRVSKELDLDAYIAARPAPPEPEANGPEPTDAEVQAQGEGPADPSTDDVAIPPDDAIPEEPKAEPQAQRLVVEAEEPRVLFRL